MQVLLQANSNCFDPFGDILSMVAGKIREIKDQQSQDEKVQDDEKASIIEDVIWHKDMLSVVSELNVAVPEDDTRSQ